VRVAIEELAARTVAAQPSSAAFEALGVQVEAMRKAALQGDVGAFRDADITFHRTVCEVSGNPFLPKLWAVMEPSLRALRVVSDPLFTGDWTAMADDHADLLSALRSVDPERAGAKFAAHARGDDGIIPDH
jgi:DNA-binding GntR family transcriptional regulator